MKSIEPGEDPLKRRMAATPQERHGVRSQSRGRHRRVDLGLGDE
jgi:hypothetical protein